MKSALLFLFLPFLGFGKNLVDNDSIQKNNPIIFSEFSIGLGKGSSSGGYLGANLNYQYKEHLFTFRYNEFVGIEYNKGIGYSIFPSYKNVENFSEYSLLYGNRYVENGFSFSWSAGLGIVYNERRKYIPEQNKYGKWNNNTNIGIPIELNVKWFKSEKKRFRAYYGLIPVGKKKVVFGRSFGFKFIGNISKNSYFGVGITYGFGTHKEYVD